MKILVIGGTTYFGKDIVGLALDAGHQVTIFSRGNQRPNFWNQVEHISGDRTDKEDFAKELANKQFDAVIDNIAFNREHVANAIDIFQGNIGQYILTSTIAIYIGRGIFDQPIQESEANFDLSDNPQFVSAPKPTPPGVIAYATGKIEAENAVVEQEKVPYTIIRPPNVMGPEDPSGRVQFYLQRLLDGNPLILTDGGIHSFQPVFSTDLARGYIQALGNSKAINQAYTIAQTKTFRLVDWVEFAAECLGVQPNLVHIPADVLQNANFEYSEQWTYTGTHTFDISKAIADLGFQPTPVEIWTSETVNWYQETTHNNDSPGYADRTKEIEFAERYLEKVTLLNS